MPKFGFKILHQDKKTGGRDRGNITKKDKTYYWSYALKR